METISIRKILIVDYREEDIYFTQRAISKIAPAVTAEVAFSGNDALDMLRSAKQLPSLILLDLTMPGISGIEVLRRIRSDSNLKDIVVVVLTNSDLQSDKEESFKAGADDFLQKAFDLDRFSSDMRSLLERYQLN